ncbi:hypothetical protein A9Q90_04255, partial [Gammaproteobacteria bacterium 54_18_T64]
APAALESYRKSMAIRQQLANNDPSNSGWQRDLSIAHERLGDTLRLQGDIAAAITAYQRSRAIILSLTQRYPENEQFQRHEKITLSRLQDLRDIEAG